jgi:hypothetical protein
MRHRGLALLVLASCGWIGAQPSAPPSPPLATAPARVAPAPTDPEPIERGSPAGSRAARPAWHLADRGYAPVVDASTAEMLFAAGTAETQSRATLDGELLACRVDVQFQEIKSWSLRPHKWAAADLLVAYGFGEGGALGDDALVTFGTNQTNHTHFVIPAARMTTGDVVDVLLNDRDRILGRDYIDRVALGFAGSTPLVSSGPISAIVCRVVAPAALQPFVHERLWNVDDALAIWQRAEPDIRSGTSTCAAPDTVKTSIAGLAAVVAWDDPRVRARIDRAAATEAAVAQACADRFGAFVRGLDAPGAPATLAGTDIGVRVIEASCDPTRIARLEATAGRAQGAVCMFALELTNRADAPFEIPGADRVHAQWEVIAFDARGRSLVTTATGAMRTVAGGATTRHEMTTGRHHSHVALGAVEAEAAAPLMIELRERSGASRRVRLRL